MTTTMGEGRIRVVTFDLDNTLWDVEPVLRRAETAQNRWLEEHRPRVMERFTAEALWEFRIKAYRRHPELAHQISKLRIQSLHEVQLHCGYSEEQSRAGASAAFDAFLAVRHQVELYERALDILEDLARRYVLGALSNGNADIFKTDIGEHFDFAFNAEHVNAGKPLPDMFHAAMSASGAQAREIVHVGDSPEHDVKGAQGVGMHTVWMNSGGESWPGEYRAADESITDLAQLPEAIQRIEQRQIARI